MNMQGKFKQVGDIVFIRLPYDARRKIFVGCQCANCRANPEREPQWDTLALSLLDGETWVVHYPEL